jgi:hypothetical protein
MLLVNAIHLPSGDHVPPISASGDVVSRRSCPVFRSRTYKSMLPLPARSDENTSCVPSGDHATSVSTAASLVTRSGLPPIVITHTSPSAANATRLPSRDARGCMIPSTRFAAVALKSRFFRW